MEKDTQAKIAILRWEQTLVPEGLQQLGDLPGNSTNPASYPFPVRLAEVPGACTETVITHPSETVCDRMVKICQDLKEEGIQAVTTSCGFNAVFQERLAREAQLPVFSSALLQISFIQSMIGSDGKILILTADSGSLKEEHFAACQIKDRDSLIICGLENGPEWAKIFRNPDTPVNLEEVETEIVGCVQSAVKEHPDIAAVLLECTDLPPFAEEIRAAVHLPVFDFISMVGHVAISLGELSLF